MAERTAATAQLEDELGVVASALSALLGADLHAILTARAGDAAARLVAEMTDGALGDETAAGVLDVLWPHGDPDLDWWRTPLGLVIAPVQAARWDAEVSWTAAEAAEVVGVARGSVLDAGRRGAVAQTADRSYSRASVLAWLLRRARRGVAA